MAGRHRCQTLASIFASQRRIPLVSSSRIWSSCTPIVILSTYTIITHMQQGHSSTINICPNHLKGQKNDKRIALWNQPIDNQGVCLSFIFCISNKHWLVGNPDDVLVFLWRVISKKSQGSCNCITSSLDEDFITWKFVVTLLYKTRNNMFFCSSPDEAGCVKGL